MSESKSKQDFRVLSCSWFVIRTTVRGLVRFVSGPIPQWGICTWPRAMDKRCLPTTDPGTLKKADFRRLAPTRADLRRLAPTCADLRRLAPTFADFRRLAPTKKNFFWTTHQNCYALCVQKRRFLSTLMKKIILSSFFHQNGTFNVGLTMGLDWKFFVELAFCSIFASFMIIF